MKKKATILVAISLMASTVTVNVASVPRESAPLNATEHQIIVVESFIGGGLNEVKNGLGYADANEPFSLKGVLLNDKQADGNEDNSFI